MSDSVDNQSGLAGARATRCKFCSQKLPTDRDSNYCPHCGDNLKISRCAACGVEMDTSWNFCIICGRRASKSPPAPLKFGPGE